MWGLFETMLDYVEISHQHKSQQRFTVRTHQIIIRDEEMNPSEELEEIDYEPDSDDDFHGGRQ